MPKKQKRSKLLSLVPKYGYAPLFLVIFTNCFVFYFSRIFTSNAFHYDVSIPLDDKIPFVPAFIVFYLLAFVQWLVTLALCARESKDFCYKAVGADVFSKLIVFLIFLVLPTSMTRGEIEGNGIFELLTKLIYTLDSPDNLFPSLHCLDSWVCLRVVFRMKKMPKWYKLSNAVMSLLIFASVVLVKQHLFLDIWGGIIVAELGFGMVRFFHVDRLLYKIIPKGLQE